MSDTVLREAAAAMRTDTDPRWHPVAAWLTTAGADLWAHGPLCCAEGCSGCDDDLWAPHVRDALRVAETYLDQRAAEPTTPAPRQG